MTVSNISNGIVPRVGLDEYDKALVSAIQSGLPLCPKPYAEIGRSIGLSEIDVMQRIQRLLDDDSIKRMGVVVRHHELGYRSNAMVVWDVPEAQVSDLGHCMSKFEFITLCYQRPRRLPDWRYNLFCMIHGRDRDEVLGHVDFMIERCGLQDIAHEALFSLRRFKQRGARY